MNKKGTLSLIQIFILIFGIIAISYAIGSGVGFVGGAKVMIGEDTGKGSSWPSISSTTDPVQGNDIKKGVLTKSTTTGTTVGDWMASDKGLGWNAGAKLGASNFVGHIASGLWWSMIVAGGIKFIGGFIDEEGALTNALSAGAFGGIMAGKATYGLIKSGGWLSDTGSAKWLINKVPKGELGVSVGVGIIVAAIIFYNSYKSEETEKVTFTCNVWDAPTGGANCEKCNDGLLPCSEYQCRSLGQACQLVNPGTDEAKCVWVNKNDVKFPVITPWTNVLLNDYVYKPDSAISPPDRGVKIWNNKDARGCAQAFTPLSFGIVLDEPAKCKIDYLRKEKFDDMDFFFGGSSLMRYNHTQIMSLPGPNTKENGTLVLQNDGNFELYVRCQDANGNENTGNFVFEFCVDKGPDTTPPIIVTTDLMNGMPIAYNQSEVNLEVYVNEPAECKWSHLDQDYDEMEETMSCASSVFEMNAQMLYKCATKLTGLKSKVDNNFYFRCKDKPKEGDRNTNAESYKFTLIGTQPLVIDEIKPDNETIKDSTDAVKVTLEAETSAGYNEGEANCYYSDTGKEDSYVMFYNTNSYTHSQELWLAEGDYTYYIKCIDLGGNSDIETISFDVETDTSAPLAVRAYHESNFLKIISNEEAECVYGNDNCNYLFDDGIKMATTDDVKHETNWNTDVKFYIKCRDKYGNEPSPDVCSIIARPSEI